MAKKKIMNIFADTDPIWKTLKGEGQWNSLVEADDYDKWSTNFYGQDVEDLEEELQAYLDEAVEFAKAQGKEVKGVADIYKEYEGKRYIQFKQKKYDDDTEPPKYYDIYGNEIEGKNRKEVGGGSTLKIKAMIKPYYLSTTKTIGLTYRLLAFQVIENKVYSGVGGFEDESEGVTPPFEADNTVEENEDY